MRDLLRWLLGIANAEDGDENSKDTARQRLRLVLIQDRLDLAPEKMEAMKREIWDVVSRYMVVEDEFMEFEVRRLDELIVELRESFGSTIVMVTHELASIFSIATNSVFLDAETRTQLATGNPSELRDECEDPKVRTFLRRGRNE